MSEENTCYLKKLYKSITDFIKESLCYEYTNDNSYDNENTDNNTNINDNDINNDKDQKNIEIIIFDSYLETL